MIILPDKQRPEEDNSMVDEGNILKLSNRNQTLYPLKLIRWWKSFLPPYLFLFKFFDNIWVRFVYNK